MSLQKDALAYHRDGRPGKIAVEPTKALQTQRDLALAYSPGVAEPCRAIADNPDAVFEYTSKGNLVAVISNGSAVLGLGNIGPLASKPVMEGKANLFKKFADIDVFDLELDANSVDAMVEAVKAVAPTFGGINLEDIKAPECFEVERRLQEALDIPVFHDDQHGTAIISAAALINACELTDRSLNDITMVFSGAGAAALACARHYVGLGVRPENIVMLDSKGVLRADRETLFEEQRMFATSRDLRTLDDAIDGADAFVGLSVGGVLKPEMILKMADRPIIFAMANPDPEIPYAVARETRPDAIVATGRSDHPNQVNNVLGFPFVFRGALDSRARKITEGMKLAATHALARLAREDVPDAVRRAYDDDSLVFGPDYIIPKPFDPRVLTYVAPAVAEAAHRDGVARTPIANLNAYQERLHALVERARGLMQPLIYRARRARKKPRIVFPDGDGGQILRAAQRVADEGICQPVLLGDPERIREQASSLGLSLEGVTIDPAKAGPLFDELAAQLWEDRKRMGMTRASAMAKLSDRTWYGAMMVKAGHADGMVGGHGRPYKATLKPALRVLGTAKGIDRVSGVYAMLFDDKKIFFGDCTVNRQPSAETLAQVALNTAAVAETFGVTPRVAMLSYSDFGEHHSDDVVRKIRRAIEHVRAARPDLQIEGEMQADTAIDWDKMSESFPFTTLTGPANVLVFPDLQSGNIAYKLLVKLAGAEALGPLLPGLAAPVSVIPLHATVDEIFNVVVYTVNSVLDKRRR
ncbi:MAG: NADP-dependent malic enzyme [Myxococcota bacterium]